MRSNRRDVDFEQPKVVLDPDEQRLAGVVAIETNTSSLKKHYVERYGGKPEQALANNHGGRGAEVAVAKYFNLFWGGYIGQWDKDDVGQLQVRWSREPNADLRLHPRDKDDRAYVLVTGGGLEGAEYTLRGWIWGDEGKKDRWWRDGEKGRPAFWVPQRALRPVSELKRLLKEHPEWFGLDDN